MQLKIAFNSSRQDRNASRTYNTLVTFLAENMFRLDEGAFIPEWAFEEAINFGYSPDTLIESVKRKVKNMSQDLEQRLLRGGLTPKQLKQYELLEQQTERQTGEGGFLKKIAGVFGKE
jgi:hypothetical protein